MRAQPRKSTLVVVLLTLTLAASSALAQSKTSAAAAGPSAQAKEQARSAYARGQAAFSAGQFEVAKAAFDEAFAAVPNPIVLLSVAEAQVKLDQVGEAVATLQHYLQLRSDAPDRADIEAKISALNATPATLAVTSEPSGAALDIDGLPTQRTTPGQLELAPGEHTLDYSLHGYHHGSEIITVKPGEKLERHLQLTVLEAAPGVSAAGPDEAPPVLASAPPAATAQASTMPTTALWVTAGVGAAGLITGSVFGFLAVKEHSNFNDHPTEASANKGERLALFADVGFGVGVMAIATAVVLYLTADDSTDAAASADTAKLQLSPQVAPHAVAASATLRF